MSGRQIRSERLAAEEAVTIPGRTRAVAVEGRPCGRTDEGEKTSSQGSSRFLHGCVSGDPASCSVDLECALKRPKKNALSLTQRPSFLHCPKPNARGACTHAVSPLSREPTSLAVPSVPGDRLGSVSLSDLLHLPSQPGLQCCLLLPRELPGLLRWLSHPDYITSWFLIISYQSA